MANKNLTLIKMKDSGELLLVRLIHNHEDFGSITYDQEYEAYDYKRLTELAPKGNITPEELKSAQTNNLVVQGVTTLPFEYARDVAPEIPPIRLVEHITYTIDIATPKKPVPDWTFDEN